MPLDLRGTVVEGKVYRTKKKREGDDEKEAMRELAAILGTKRRQACNCEAQIHDLLENCLECGRFTCESEGSGPCLHCGATVLSQTQRERLMKHLDFLRPSTTSSGASSGPRTKIIDNQYDHFAIDRKKHLREEDRSRMKANLEELQAKRYQRKLMLDIDIDNLEAGSRSMPQVDDYEAELRRLQLDDCAPTGRNSGITLTQLVADESKNNYKFEYVDLNEAKKQRAKSEGVVINIGSTTQKQKHSQLKNKSEPKKSNPKQSSSKQPNVWGKHNNNNYDNKETKK